MPCVRASQPDYYKVECKSQGGAHWLNISKTNLPGDSRPDLGALVASGSNYHVPEVNLAEGNLLTIAQKQSDAYVALTSKIDALEGKLAKAEKKLGAKKDKVGKLTDKLKQADGAGERRAAKRKVKKAKKAVKKARGQVKSLKEQLAELEQQLP